jgi:hypothetical protein
MNENPQSDSSGRKLREGQKPSLLRLGLVCEDAGYAYCCSDVVVDDFGGRPFDARLKLSAASAFPANWSEFEGIGSILALVHRGLLQR